MFHCFNVSKHISISVLFFFCNFCLMILFFCWIFENNCPRGWGFSTIFLSQGSGFRTVFVPRRVGNLPFQKIPWGFAWGGWSGLELTDTLWLSMTTERTSGFHRPIARRPVMLLGASCLYFFQFFIHFLSCILSSLLIIT